MIEKISRKLAFTYPEDNIYSGCEILCDEWLRKRRFCLEDIREALKVIGIDHSEKELAEIVLATEVSDFCNEDLLYAEILIRQIAFE